MQSWVNYVRGSVTLQVEGDFPERFLNLCARRGIEFWDIKWQGEHCLQLTIHEKSLTQAKDIGTQVLCIVVELSHRGVPSVAGGFRRRYAFLVGLSLSMIAVLFLSQFIITIEVEGNELVSSQEIIWALRRQGLSIGTYGPAVDERLIANEALLQLSGISWMSINIQGTKAEVLVRETVDPPEMVDQSIMGDVVAEADGIILHVEAEKGEPLVIEGSTVLAGEILISGMIELSVPEYSELEVDWYQVRASGEVYARTWRTLEGQIPLEGEQKSYTGEETHQWYINFFGYRFNFFGNSGISFAKYDKINETWMTTLSDGSTLPISLGLDTLSEYETMPATINQSAAQTMIEEELTATLMELIGEDGQVDNISFSVREENGMLVVTLTAECQEEIGRFVPWE